MLIWQESSRKSWFRKNSAVGIGAALPGASICPSFPANNSRRLAWLGMSAADNIYVEHGGENMNKEITLAQLQTMVERSGLNLTDEEVEKLLPGVNRSHNQILELRELITDNIEPATAFAASRTKKS